MELRVLKNHVAIEEIKEPEKTKSGIFIPGSEKKGSMKGTVVSVGPGIYDKKGNRTPPPFKKGDVVLYSKGSGQTMQISLDEKLLVLKPEDILAKLM